MKPYHFIILFALVVTGFTIFKSADIYKSTHAQENLNTAKLRADLTQYNNELLDLKIKVNQDSVKVSELETTVSLQQLTINVLLEIVKSQRGKSKGDIL